MYVTLSRLRNSGCLLTTLQKALKERGIDTMLEEARADNRDNDAEYMKPSINSRCTLPRLERDLNADVRQNTSPALCIAVASGTCIDTLLILYSKLFQVLAAFGISTLHCSTCSVLLKLFLLGILLIMSVYDTE